MKVEMVSSAMWETVNRLGVNLLMINGRTLSPVKNWTFLITGLFRMVKFKVTKQKNRSGDKFWVIFSDKIDDKIIRKLQGFLSMHQIKVVTRSKIYHCFDQFLRSLGQCCSSRRSRQNLSNGYAITRQWHQNRHTSGSFLLTLINMFLCQVFNFFNL